MKKQNPNSKKPFFAHFLEAQSQEDIQGGIDAQTQKYPSDQEDVSPTSVLADTAQTQKYPSDQEDNPGTLPGKDGYQTQKYPSDNDEAGDLA